MSNLQIFHCRLETQGLLTWPGSSVLQTKAQKLNQGASATSRGLVQLQKQNEATKTCVQPHPAILQITQTNV